MQTIPTRTGKPRHAIRPALAPPRRLFSLSVHRLVGVCVAALAVAWCLAAAASEAPPAKPFTFAYVAYPCLTEQVDRLAANRKFLGANVKDLAGLVERVNTQAPAFVALMGDITWFGDDRDYATAGKILGGLKSTTYPAAGPSDLAAGPAPSRDAPGAERFTRTFQQPLWYSFDHQEAHFLVAGAVPEGRMDEFLTWFEADLTKAKDARQVLVLATWTPSDDRYAKQSKKIRELACAHKVTAWVGGHRYGPGVQHPEGLPVVNPPAAGWSGMFSHLLITVEQQGIVVALNSKSNDLLHKLTLPNPRTATGDDAAGPRYLAQYRRAVARKPLLSFVQISDSQIDDGTNPKSAARYQHGPADNRVAIAEINALEPPPALIVSTGDLTNNSRPAEWKTYMSIVGTLRAPVHHIPGNHDRDPDGSFRAFEQATGGKPHDAWDAGEVAFIAMNTAAGSVDAAQRDWLGAELKKAKDRRAVFVIGHHPLDVRERGTVEEGRDEVIRLLDEHRVTAYLCGHRHRWHCSRVGGFLHYLCNDLCWHTDIGYAVYHVFADHVLACYKPVGEDCFWELTWPNPRACPVK